MSLIDKVIERHDALGLFKVFVPEWNTYLYFNAVPSGAVDKAGKGLRDDQQFEKYCRLIVALARTEDGDRAFDHGDIATLLRKGEVRVITAAIETALNYEEPENDPN